MSKLIDLTEQKFTRLIALSFEKGKWNCICECGNTLKVAGSQLMNGNTKSCGCLKTDNLMLRSHKLSEGKRQFEPHITSARRIWQNSYLYRDPLCLEFDKFLEISQLNCFYCGTSPNNKYNYFLASSSRGSLKAQQEGLFIYNGLDRINSYLSHTIDNVVPCCYDCNRAKNNRSMQDFYDWIEKLSINNFQPIDIVQLRLPINGSLLTSIKCVFYNHKNDTDLSIEEYYSISQMNCFYCNDLPNNVFNKAKIDKKASLKAKENGDYIYNGIDCIDRSFPHNKDNIVPCCKYCNFAKGKLSLSEFQLWIKRVKKFQNSNVIFNK